MSAVEGHWLLDLGNTRLKLARIREGRVLGQGAWLRDEDDVLPKAMQGLLASMTGNPVWMASSAGDEAGRAVQQALEDAGCALRLALTQAACGRLRIAYGQPERLGVDRFLALLAASERDDGPWLLASVGSALTLDLLERDGQHLGGLIALSPSLHREALAARIPHLDVAGGRAVDFASDTADALASGAMASALGAIERSLRLAESRLGRPATLLLAGGGAGPLLPLLPPSARHCPGLVLDGLASYARHFASLPP